MVLDRCRLQHRTILPTLSLADPRDRFRSVVLHSRWLCRSGFVLGCGRWPPTMVSRCRAFAFDVMCFDI